MTTSWTLLPTYADITAESLLLYVVAGVFGALVRVALLDKPIRGFYRDKRTGGWKMGFFGEVVTAVAVAVIVAGHPIRAGVASIFAPWFLASMQSVLVDRLPAILRAILKTALDTNQKE